MGAMSRWTPNATWRTPNATRRARFALFWADSDPWSSCHVALEAQHDMAGSQYDVEGRNTMWSAFFWVLQQKKATSELGQRWQALFLLFAFMFA